MRSHSFVERVPWLFSMRGWLLWTAPLAFNGHTAKYFSWFSFFLLFIICFGLPATSCRLSVPCWVALRFSLFTLFLCQKEKKNAPETHVNKKVAQQAHDAGVDLLATDQTKEGRQVIHVNGSQVSGPERTNPANGVPLRRFYSVLFVVFFLLSRQMVGGSQTFTKFLVTPIWFPVVSPIHGGLALGPGDFRNRLSSESLVMDVDEAFAESRNEKTMKC